MKDSQRARQAAHLSNMADSLIAKGDYQAAEQWAAKALELSPWCASALNNLAVAKLQNGKPMEALDAINEAIQSDPGSHKTWCNRGVIHHRLSDPVKAAADYSQAIRLNPESPEAYAGRAQAMSEVGRMEEADRDINMADQLLPGNPAIYQTRAEYHRLAGRHEAALADVNGCLDQHWETPMLRYTQGLTLAAMERLAEAESSLDRALELEPLFVQAYQERATLHMLNAKVRAAIKDYQRAIELHVTSRQACFSYIGLAIAIQALGRHDDAQTCLDRAQEHTTEPELLGDIASLRETLAGIASRKDDPADP